MDLKCFLVLALMHFLGCVYAHRIVRRSADWSSDMDEETWNNRARETLDTQLKRKQNKNVAKNAILFLGDGMGISTVTAGRILKGQLKKKNGEEEVTVMESLDNLALSKTYNIDAQTPDSAGTATAYLSGVKTRIGVIGLNGHAVYGDCKSAKNAEINSILDWAVRAGKSVGIVTTTRITHATPAGAYAHTPDRDWEGFDGINFKQEQADANCKDIAAQLVDNNHNINVVFGGGRKFFLPNTVKDYQNNEMGGRIDNRNLIEDWKNIQESGKKKHKFLWNATDLRNLDTDAYDHVFGLFAFQHLEYELLRDKEKEPSLSEMTEKAIKMLSRNPKGFFLLVEGGRIDHAHHESKAKKSLYEFAAFDEAIGVGLKMTSLDDTIITVTADHSHTFSIGGYSNRGNPIFGLVYNSYGNLSDAKLTYTSLLYANGPGGLKEIRTKNLTDEEVENPEYIQEAAVSLRSETHGGEDVPIYSSGPMAHLFEGTVEQSFVAHAMAYSTCIGPYDNAECLRERGHSSSSSVLIYKKFLLILPIFLAFKLI